MISWGVFAEREPELAAFGAARLAAAPAYLATVRSFGAPRVHPITPVLTTEGLYVFMEPTSPKRHDLLERGWYALHCGVADNHGSGGEFFVSGRGAEVADGAVRAVAAAGASYEPTDRYVLFELTLGEARANGYGDVPLPAHDRWSAEG